jgi:CHAT domain-containing protein/tetratricopeptide (TPR) repeat protein
MMLRARWAGLALLLAGLAAGPARGQELPKSTPEGRKAADELLAACVRDGGLTQVGKGAAAAWRIDPVKLRATLAARRDRLTPAVRDALVAEGFGRNATRRQMLAAVLEAFGQEREDERALGFAALVAGRMEAARLQTAKAEALYRRAAGHFATASDPGWQALSLNGLGLLHHDRGEYARAEEAVREAVAVWRRLYPADKFPDGHLRLATGLNDLGILLMYCGEHARAEEALREAVAMRRRLYPADKFPDGHRHLALSLNALGELLWGCGEYARAEGPLQEALAMRRKLYPAGKFPDGHSELATSLNDLGILLMYRGEHARAEEALREAVAMRRRLYPAGKFPDGHSGLATSLNALGMLLLQVRGEYARAEGPLQEALAMRRRLYPADKFPAGHPALATSLNNMGLLLLARGEYAQAEPYYRKAVAMRRRLYPADKFPDGHPALAANLNNLGSLLHDWGKYAEAESLLREALAVYQRHADRLAQSAPEAQALNFAATFPLTRDAYLSATRRLPGHSAAEAYALVWQSKAALTRVYQRRHLALRAAAASDEVRSRWRDLLELRRRRAALLLAPAPADPAARDRLLNDLGRQAERLERELLPLLPAAERAERLARSSPDDLRKALPARAALVDLLRYIDFEQDPRKPGREGLRRTPRYVAFVVSRVGVARVELGEAGPIERAVADWRAAITAYRPDLPDPAPRHAAAARRLLWEKLAGHLPAGAEAVYLAPDGPLTAVPWAALPGRRAGTVLLEEHALAVLPHGPFLLDRLTAPPAKAERPATLLAVGAVRYDDPPAPPPAALAGKEVALGERAGPAVGGALRWGYLEGSARELQCVADLAKGRKIQRLAGAEAGTERLLAELPRTRVAHLATHGFFAGRAFRSVLQLDERLFARRMSAEGHIGERVGEGARSPLVLSGLVLAGANRPDVAGRGILTADAVAGLDLSGLELAVLSACETGLGDVAGGEGVYGLQRAFHVAGAKDVVASLWKVDDEATAALMALFYRNLWQGKLPPVEALRRAQLALYRHPEHVKAWARGERGPDLKRPAPGSKPAAAAGEGAKPGGTAATKLWAAFVLSGLGRQSPEGGQR